MQHPTEVASVGGMSRKLLVIALIVIGVIVVRKATADKGGVYDPGALT